MSDKSVYNTVHLFFTPRCLLKRIEEEKSNSTNSTCTNTSSMSLDEQQKYFFSLIFFSGLRAPWEDNDLDILIWNEDLLSESPGIMFRFLRSRCFHSKLSMKRIHTNKNWIRTNFHQFFSLFAKNRPRDSINFEKQLDAALEEESSKVTLAYREVSRIILKLLNSFLKEKLCCQLLIPQPRIKTLSKVKESCIKAFNNEENEIITLIYGVCDSFEATKKGNDLEEDEYIKCLRGCSNNHRKGCDGENESENLCDENNTLREGKVGRPKKIRRLDDPWYNWKEHRCNIRFVSPFQLDRLYESSIYSMQL